uniref:Uncharacterized protein n=1 Tax=Cacopsylla melanoneura TaxID=428564 RepID=A0A8D8XBM7_9HEMI
MSIQFQSFLFILYCCRFLSLCFSLSHLLSPGVGRGGGELERKIEREGREGMERGRKGGRGEIGRTVGEGERVGWEEREKESEGWRERREREERKETHNFVIQISRI